MPQIKNIIFDLGGVLLNIDYNKTAQAFQQLGVTNFDELYSQYKANPLFEELETGKISEAAFYQAIEQYCRPATSQKDIENAWNAMLLSFRTESLDFLVSLKDRYNLFLLSNTNSIHLKAFQQIFTTETGKASLDNYFTKCYYSHIIQMRKPYMDVYQFVLQEGNMNAEETLFIDDSINNVNTAKELGMQVHHLLATEKIEDLQY